MDKNLLIKYADLAIKKGVNLQKGQHLEILCSTERADFAEILTERAYIFGAKSVGITWENQKIERLKFENESIFELENIKKWEIEKKEFLVEDNACYIAVDTDDPNAFFGVNEEKIAKHVFAKNKAFKKYRDAVMKNGIRWCVIAMPSSSWANTVFKGEKEAEEKLFSSIAQSVRLFDDDPIKSWNEHILTLNKRAKFLNDNNFYALKFKNSIGTDLTVGLAENHIFQSAEELAMDKIKFVANMPTEEIFTSPHNLRVNGVVKNALPLSFNGNIIDKFSLTFKDGKIVDYSAKVGFNALKSLIETDDGTLSIGEVALIGKNSPIAKTGILFYNTLFDENASSHLAIGQGYPTTVKGGSTMSKEELLSLGVNDSVEHVDFMIGTPDLSVVGIKQNGEEIPLFIDGDWVI